MTVDWKPTKKTRLLPYREVAVAFGSIGGERLPRNEITDIMSKILGLSRHTCLLHWKGRKPVGVNLYARMVCWYVCLLFATNRTARIRGMGGVPLTELTEWERDREGKIIGVSCVIDGTVHYTLLFTRFEREMAALGYELECYGNIGAA